MMDVSIIYTTMNDRFHIGLRAFDVFILLAYIIDYWICILIRVCVHVTIIITRHDQAYSL